MALTTVLPIEPAAQDEAPGLACTQAVLRHMAHEMRQPLSTIESTAFYLGIILSEADEKARNHVEKLQGLVQQINSILSDTLLLTEGIHPRIETLDFCESVSACMAEQGGGLALEIDEAPADAGVWLARLDPSLSRRMVVSLLQFSRNYGADEAGLQLALRNCGATIRLSVSFAPATMVLANLDSLFDPMTPLVPGGGAIALTLVRRLAESQKGKFAVERESPGRIALNLDVPAVLEG